MFGGRLMDSIKELIAEKFGTTDVIRANSEAEARELKEAKQRISELEENISQMRRLSLKCAETNEMTTQLVQSAIDRIEEIKGVSAEGTGKEELEKISADLAALQESVAKAFKDQEEAIHKENVKVYRNVQGALIDELKQQSEAIAIQHLHIEKKLKGVKPIAIIALCFSGVNLAAILAAIVYYIMVIGF